MPEFARIPQHVINKILKALRSDAKSIVAQWYNYFGVVRFYQ